MDQELCQKLAAYFTLNPNEEHFRLTLKSWKESPTHTALGGLHFLTGEIVKAPPDSAALATSAFILGMIVPFASKDPMFQKIIAEFFEKNKRAKGENVVEFSQVLRKAGPNV